MAFFVIWKEKENISTNRLFFSKALMHTCIENLVHIFVRAKQVKNLLPLFGTLGKLFIFLQSMPNNAHYCACEWAQKMRSSTWKEYICSKVDISQCSKKWRKGAILQLM